MRVVVHSAAIQDRDGAGLVPDKIRRRFPWLELIWADGGYNAWQVDAAVLSPRTSRTSRKPPTPRKLGFAPDSPLELWVPPACDAPGSHKVRC
jgi:hypothetical protein